MLLTAKQKIMRTIRGPYSNNFESGVPSGNPQLVIPVLPEDYERGLAASIVRDSCHSTKNQQVSKFANIMGVVAEAAWLRHIGRLDHPLAFGPGEWAKVQSTHTDMPCGGEMKSILKPDLNLIINCLDFHRHGEKYPNSRIVLVYLDVEKDKLYFLGQIQGKDFFEHEERQKRRGSSSAMARGFGNVFFGNRDYYFLNKIHLSPFDN